MLKFPSLPAMGKALGVFLLGVTALVLGAVFLPLTLLLLYLREKRGVTAEPVVTAHETLGCLLWVGLSLIIQAGAELAPPAKSRY